MVKWQSSSSYSGRYIPFIATFIGICLIGIFVHTQWLRIQEEKASTQQALNGAASLLAKHMAQTFELAEKVLLTADDIRKTAIAEKFDETKLHRLLSTVQSGSPFLRSVDWIDANGDRVATSRGLDLPPLNVSAFRPFDELSDEKWTGEGLYISPPAFAKSFDDWIFIIALRIETSDGKFNGILAGVANLDYFAEIFKSTGLGETGVVQLLRADGIIIAREPFDESLLNRSWADRRGDPASPAMPLKKAFHQLGFSPNSDQMISIASVLDGAAYVSVSKSPSEIYTGFWEIFIEEAILLIMLGFSTLAVMRHLRRRKQLEIDLQMNRGRFEDFASAAGDWLWETDSKHRLTWISAAVERSFNRKPEWFYSKSPLNLNESDIGETEYQRRWDLLSNQKPFRDFEFFWNGPGKERWISSSAIPIFDGSGAFSGYRGSSRDITELKRAELRLREAVDAFPGQFLLFDKDQRLTFYNYPTEGPEDALHLHLELGMTFEAIVRNMITNGSLIDAQDDPESFITERLKLFYAGKGSTFTRLKNAIVEVFERPTHDGGVISLRFDVTEREHAFATQRMALETAAAANLAKSEFLASMSHELRTPLNAIIGFGQIMQIDQQNTLTPDHKEYVDHIVDSGMHLLNLIKEVLDLSTIESGHLALKLEPVPIMNVLTHAIASMRPIAEKANIRLAPIEKTIIPDARADILRLRQVLQNLLSNAIKYNRPGGSVLISAVVHGAFIRISVKDTGIGIAPEFREKIYTPFDRLGAENSSVEGVGIGLTLCKQLLEAMGGQINFTSEKGVGTTFTVDLQIDEKILTLEQSSSRSAAAPYSQPRAGGYALLYVEDNPANVRLVEHLVKMLPGATVYSASSAERGLELAHSRQPDVIILDLNLPGMGGLEILRRLKANPSTQDIPVIALTAAAKPQDIQRGLTAGFHRYITKPVDVNAFLEAVEEALTHAPAPPKLANSAP